MSVSLAKAALAPRSEWMPAPRFDSSAEHGLQHNDLRALSAIFRRSAPNYLDQM